MALPKGNVPKGCMMRVPIGQQHAQIGKDQITDYALRHRKSVDEVEKWLGPYLDYEV